ncbi:MAG: GIY-YIG nuclease family protein [Candidatus Pacebacteria bacterium]|nr:GIY-YIG nuclease family protein [Candidatus Paceibacterota bacterium]
MSYYTYILQCKDHTLYIGSTNNLEKRLLAHNTSKSGAHYTKIRRPVTLKYSEKFETKGEALKREYALKKFSRLEKMKLLQRSQLQNP